eukprot:jgi/Tetstr1/426796/TSEL_017011.t1
MGLFDVFRGKRAPEAEEGLEAEAGDAATPPNVSEELASSSGASVSSGAGGTAALGLGALPSGDGGELYNPYKGLQTALDARGAGDGGKPGFRVAQRPEFVFVEDGAVRRRGWSENLTYYTGAGYLAGAAVGGGLGAAAALREPAAGVSRRLALNRFLNASGKTGRTYGNTLGVVGLYFAVSESTLFSYGEEYGAPDAISTLGAGFATGALFRATRGPRPAAVAGAVGMAGAGLLLAGRAFIAGGL